jgi:hypothetical protein
MIEMGMEDKRGPTSMMKKGHQKGQDQKLDSKIEYQERILSSQDASRYPKYYL